MHTPAPGPAAAPNARSAERCGDAEDPRRAGDRFDRLLRDKAAAFGDDDDSTSPIAPEGVVCAQPMPLALAVPTANAPRNCGAVADAATPTQAALDASLAAPHAPEPVHANHGAPQSWQVSLREPLGVPMELQATRVPSASQASGATTWALNISTTSRDAAVLNRQASRLDERLRARALHLTHVRIGSDEQEL
jgi:hypothetical protein